jgi:hypothetical protein
MMRLNSILLAAAAAVMPACGTYGVVSQPKELTDADIAPYIRKLDELSSASGKVFMKAPTLPWGRALTVIGFIHRELIGNDRRLAALRARTEKTVLLTSTDPAEHDADAINVICDGNYPKYFVWDLDK